MAGGKHVVVWPKCRVSVKGKARVIAKGELVPEGVSDADLDNLVSFGAIAGAASAVAPEPDGDGKPTSVKDILKDVGDDKAKAQEYLDAETAKGDDARGTLVEKLQAITKAN